LQTAVNAALGPEKAVGKWFWISIMVNPYRLLARLAVDWRFSRKGLGHALISEAFKIALRVADDVGCRCIVTDAYRDKIDWYARYGFVSLEGGAESGLLRMFLDIRTVRLAVKSSP
jgi:GNAT superfamily N-acetyltransferase